MRRALLLAPLFALLGGCWLRPAVVPVPTIRYPALRTEGGPAGAPADSTLVIYLPGRGDPAGAFASHGLVDAVHRVDPRAEVLAVDAHMGYYRNGTAGTRIWEDVVKPARERGYTRIWIVGNSMGGAGALWLATDHADAITGIVLLAPYLGPDEMIDEIERAGGPRTWTPAPAGENDGQWRTWRWLRARGAPEAAAAPALWLGFGRQDRLARADRLLATVLPTDHVVEIDGKHTWNCWTALFAELLKRGALASAAAAPAGPSAPSPATGRAP